MAKQLQFGEDDVFLALGSAWNLVSESLSQKVSKPSYESWIKPIVPLSFEEGVAVLGTPSRFGKHWLEGKHLDEIRALLEEQLGQGIRVVLRQFNNEEKPISLIESLPPAKKKEEKLADDPAFTPLNSRYNLDSFVVGSSNRLAYATACAISEAPGKTYNPFFLYGRAGLGKTHLLHAIGLAIQQEQPNLKVAYIRGETFTFQYITSLREHRISEFRRRYRKVDVWLVDDIQFLVGKEKTEEEFFHTFNSLFDSGKQVILSSDRAPKDLELDSRLLSRFECGMIADIVSPDLETRVAILQEKALKEEMILPDDVALYVATLITSNVRQLEGALIKLHAYGALMKTAITKDLAEEVLGNYFIEADKALPLDPRLVQLAVSRKFGVDVDDLIGTKRSKHIVLPRQVAMYLSRELTNVSLPAIGRAFGGKDHTTVLHSVDKIRTLIETDKDLAYSVEAIAKELRNGNGSDC